MSYEKLLIHTCFSGTSTSSQNSLGEWAYTWSYATTELPCRFIPLNASERIELAGKYDNVTFKAYLESSNRVTTYNRVQYGSKYYRVRDSRLDSSYHNRSLLLEELP